MATLPTGDDRSFSQVYGYSAVDDWLDTGTIPAANARAPLVDAQIRYDAMTQQNKMNAQIAQYQNEFNEEMWNKQNAYNSPDAVMQRLVKAGINPRAYQQIGQFANAEKPHAAVGYEYKSPMAELARFSEMAALKLQKQQLNLERLKVATDTVNQGLQYKIAKDKTAESIRHHEAQEAIENVALMLQDDKFRYELAKAGVRYNASTRQFDIPIGDIRLEARTKHEILKNLTREGIKLETENDYLKAKKLLETVNTGSKAADTALKLLMKIL